MTPGNAIYPMTLFRESPPSIKNFNKTGIAIAQWITLVMGDHKMTEVILSLLFDNFSSYWIKVDFYFFCLFCPTHKSRSIYQM